MFAVMTHGHQYDATEMKSHSVKGVIIVIVIIFKILIKCSYQERKLNNVFIIYQQIMQILPVGSRFWP